MLTQFHGENVQKKIQDFDIESEIKEAMQEEVQKFMKDLFEMAEYDPCANKNGEGMKPSFNYM